MNQQRESTNRFLMALRTQELSPFSENMEPTPQ
jgi:hypothetical protein